MTRHSTRRHALALLGTTAWAALPLVATAAGYPERPVTVVVPYSPGGGVDIITRLVTPPMAELLGQSLVVDNKPGGGTNIGMGAVARGAADGYLLLTASNTLTTNKALYAKLNFDPLKDLIPVGRIGEAPLVVVVNAKSPHKNLAELIAAGKAKAGALSYGTAGVGSSGHMASALLERAGGFQAVHIPYKGGSAAVTDLLGGRLDFMAINPLEVAGHVGSGALRALAVLNHNGSRLLPGVPTARSLGVNVQATVWWGLVAPAGTPPEVINRLNAAFTEALRTPETQQRFAQLMAEPVPTTPEQFGQFMARERTRYEQVVKRSGAKVD